MKNRAGFVSNSSSSSFIVALPHKPESIKDLQDMIFPNNEQLFSVGFDADDEKYPTCQVTETIMQDIEDESADLYEIEETINSGHSDDMPDYHKYQDKDGNIDWDRYNIACKGYAVDRAKKFMEDNPNAFIFCASYSDDTPYGCAMEHGLLFENVYHIQVSNH